jgi:GT2 family glycosyltransferase
MDLSIIIVNYRGWNKLRECLDALKSFTNRKIISEVIIVDNSSGDGIIENFCLDYPGFRFVTSEINGGFAYGCNRGGKESSGNYLLFLNPDTIAGEDAVTALYERAVEYNGDYILSCRQKDEKNRESIAYGQFIVPGKLTGPGRALNRFIRRITGRQNSHSVQNPLSPEWVSGSVIMVSREFFNRLGGFDEDFWMYFEDMDLCRRARNMGGEIMYFTDFSITHKHGGSSRINIYTTALTKTEVLISKHLYIARHLPPASRFCAQVFLVGNNLVTGLVSAIVGIVFFFNPRMFVRAHIFLRLTCYYAGALVRRSWISPRSVNKTD